jgi:TolA-binding protein
MIREHLRVAAIAAVAAVVPLHAVRAEPAESADPVARLAELGGDLDAARALAAPEKSTALERILSALDEVRGDLPKDRRAEARFLAGEVHFELREPSPARKDYETADKAWGDGPFRDDARFAILRAREASGDDADAAKGWARWLRDHPHSPLRAEATLALAWNAVRRDSLRAATETLDGLEESFPWMTSEPRTRLARGTIAYLEGRAGDALAALDEGDTGPAAEYLRGLALRARGETLPAAARFQEVAQRWPDSPLRDPALLAKANVFLASKAWRSAAEEFGRVATAAHRDDVRAEAELRRAAAVFLAGDTDGGVELLRQVAAARSGTGVAARAQYLLGETLFSENRYEEAIAEFGTVLTRYFDHDLAPRAQYRIGRSLDALGRAPEATGAYQAVVSGYSQAPEAPAAGYLAGVGLLETGRPLAAVPYFQIVLDRYAKGDEGTLVFASPEHQEIVEAALCLLELSYHRAGDMAQLAGVPHLLLSRMPVSDSPWRANALLIDADALASLGRFEEARALTDRILQEFPEQDVALPATRLLAWIHAREGHDDLAIATEEQMLERYASRGDVESLAGANLRKAHVLFNDKRFAEAAAAYDDFARRFPDAPDAALAIYQAGLCHLRLGNNGDAVDRWESVAAKDPEGELGTKALARAGDVYFRAERYDDARRSFAVLLERLEGSPAAARAELRIAQCDYNGGRDAEALRGFSDVVARFPDTPSAREAERGIELALYRLGQQEDGADVLAQLVERFPGSSFAADAQFEIARRLHEAEDWAAAAEEFRHVVTQFPSYSAADRAHYLMGDSYERAGLQDEARSAYEQFLYFFPQSPLRTSVQFRLGTLRFEAGDAMQAAVDFTAVLDAETSGETRQAALYNLALCQLTLGQDDAALASLESFRESQGPNDARATDVAYRLGTLHERGGRFENAVSEYRRALDAGAEPTLATELHYRIGTCRESLEEPDGAVRAYRRSVSVGDPSSTYPLSALARLAAIYESQERWGDAQAAYRQLARTAKDPELVAAAKERVTQLEQFTP